MALSGIAAAAGHRTTMLAAEIIAPASYSVESRRKTGTIGQDKLRCIPKTLFAVNVITKE
jgi:hypothetical protein